MLEHQLLKFNPVKNVRSVSSQHKSYGTTDTITSDRGGHSHVCVGGNLSKLNFNFLLYDTKTFVFSSFQSIKFIESSIQKSEERRQMLELLKCNINNQPTRSRRHYLHHPDTLWVRCWRVAARFFLIYGLLLKLMDVCRAAKKNKISHFFLQLHQVCQLTTKSKRKVQNLVSDMFASE